MKMLLTECLSCDTITCMRVHVRERISHDFACWQEEWSRKDLLERCRGRGFTPPVMRILMLP